jgi:hypothetical protein
MLRATWVRPQYASATISQAGKQRKSVMPGSVLRSERFVISVERRGRHHKVFQCQFAKRDGSVFISFPYFDHTTGFVCSTSLGLPGQERCLLISCEPLPRLDQARESSLLFMAGFDRAAAMNDVSQSVTFLALSYPAEDVDDLRRRIGSIDFKVTV